MERIQSLGGEGRRWKWRQDTPNLTSRWCLGVRPTSTRYHQYLVHSLVTPAQPRELRPSSHPAQFWYQGSRAVQAAAPVVLHPPRSSPRVHCGEHRAPARLRDAPGPQSTPRCPKCNSSVHALLIALTPRRSTLKMPGASPPPAQRALNQTVLSFRKRPKEHNNPSVTPYYKRTRACTTSFTDVSSLATKMV